MSDASDRDRAKTKVLVDNTAQTVHKNLTKLIQEKPLFKVRWIWELLQNARDVAPLMESMCPSFASNTKSLFATMARPSQT
jgi:hypothetical protein